MKILYVSNRLNSSDGSSVHGRAFVVSVEKLGHKIITFPSIKPIKFEIKNKICKNKPLKFYLKKFNINTLKFYLKKTNNFVNDLICYLDGVYASKKQFKELEQLYLSFKPDVIIFRYTLFNNAPIMIKKKYKVPCIAEINTINHIEYQFFGNKRMGDIPKRAELFALAQSNFVFCVSEPIKNWIDETTKSNKTRVIPNGVDIEMFNATKYDKEKFKNNLSLNGKCILGYIGSYKKWHGIDTSIAIIKQLSKINQKFHLLLIGNGDEYNHIRALISEYNLLEHVTQIDYVDHSATPEYLAIFDYALMTYPVIENFYFSPLKMFEYLAMGITVVSTNIGQIGKILTHKETGILISPPKHQNFTDAILEMDNNPADLQKIRANARALAIKELSWQINAEKVLNLCEECLQLNRSY